MFYNLKINVMLNIHTQKKIVDLNREYGDNHTAGDYDEEDNTRRRRGPLHELCSRICCCF